MFEFVENINFLKKYMLISMIVAFIWKYLNEECWSGSNHQLSFRYFYEFTHNSKITC